ncbi:MAG: hydrogen gas-evolving membrane-bound hydrogenase subunit E, partial [Alphaproteobacteria bacterium]
TEMSVLLSAGSVIKDSTFYPVIVILVLGGAFTKSAQVPLHFWLPNAMEAPTPVSAYLHSATMVKAGVYLLMRMNPVLGDTILWSALLSGFGAATLLTGTLLALRQDDLKLILAYTTVASLGLLVMLIGVGTQEALLGAVVYLFAHSLFKGALFMVAGGVDHATGTRNMPSLGGLAKFMPITAVTAGLAALSMSGILPFAGFVAKEVMYADLAAGDWPSYGVAVVAMVGNALMMAAAMAIAIKPFFGAQQDTPRQPHESPVSLWIGPLVLAVAGLAAGFGIGVVGRAILLPTTSAVYGFLVEAQLHLWGGFNAALLMSLVTMGAGIGLFLVYPRVRHYTQILFDGIGWGPDRGFDQFISKLVALAVWMMARIQSGSMSRYMLIIFLTTAAALFWPLIAGGEMPAMPAMPELFFYEWSVLGICVIGVGAVLYAPTRLIAVVSLGIQGFAVALIFMLFGAPDLSFTQFMIETLSVVILALVLTRLKMDRRDLRSTAERLRDGTLALVVGAGFGLALLRVTQGVLDLRLSDFFGEFSATVAHGRNIVNVILVDFRALDTLGEIAVVLVAGLAVTALIRMRGSSGARSPQQNERGS